MNDVLVKAKKLFIPSKKLVQEKYEIANKIFKSVKETVSKYPEIIDVEFGGSYAKGTWLPEKADIDIFIKFEKSVPEKSFVEIAKKVGFESLQGHNPYVRYSEHPYVEAVVKKTKVNVVPCYDVELGKWQSSADRSSFHTKFMLKELTKSMKDEVRLLKGFLKANKIYGAEIAKEGFSGYVAEVLILNYGSFEKTLDIISKIIPKQVVGKSTKVFDTPIVIMDPIDSNRNLAAAISSENIGGFVLASRAFLKKPSLKFFKSGKGRILPKNLQNVIIVKFNFSQRAPDIIWGQIKRASSAIAVQLDLEGYSVLRKTSTADEKKEAVLLFLLESIKIPKNQLKEGPEFFNQSDSERFIQKNIKKTKLMWVAQDMRLVSLQEKKFNDAVKFLQYFLKKDLTKSGIPKGLHPDLKKGFKVTKARENLSKSIKEALVGLVNTDEKIFYSSK